MPDAVATEFITIPSGAPEGGAVLEWASEEVAARVEWVRERIAGMCLEPNESANWPGRAELLRETQEKFVLPPLEAGQLVDHVVVELKSDGSEDVATQRKLSFLRLRAMRRLVLKAIEDGRTEITYKFENVIVPHPTEPGKTVTGQRKEKFKEKTYSGVEMGQVAQLLAIEQAMEQLQGLMEKTTLKQQNTLNLILNQSKKRKSGEVEDQSNGSLAAQAKMLTLEDLAKDPGALAKLGAAVAELTGESVPEAPKKPKKVKSKVRTTSPT